MGLLVFEVKVPSPFMVSLSNHERTALRQAPFELAERLRANVLVHNQKTLEQDQGLLVFEVKVPSPFMVSLSNHGTALRPARLELAERLRANVLVHNQKTLEQLVEPRTDGPSTSPSEGRPFDKPVLSLPKGSGPTCLSTIKRPCQRDGFRLTAVLRPSRLGGVLSANLFSSASHHVQRILCAGFT